MRASIDISEISDYLKSQIPVVALDVLAPEQSNVLLRLRDEFLSKLKSETYIWNIGYGTLKKVAIAEDNGLVLQECPEFKNPPNIEPLLYIFDYIQKCDKNKKAVFIISDIAPFIDGGSRHSVEIASKVKNLCFDLKPTDKRLIILGQNIKLDESLVRLIPYCEMQLPTIEKVVNHFNEYISFITESAACKDIKLLLKLNSDDIEELGRALLGLTLEEIGDFMRLNCRKKRNGNTITVDRDLINAAVQYKTRILAQMQIELAEPSDIDFGGLDILREWLHKRRRLFNQEARNYNLPKPKGMLLAGPPGTGKSLVAKTTAKILNLPLLQLDLASMLGSLVGESEANVKRALKTAEAIAPCILWLDEVEKALSGSGDTSGVSQRILGMILTFMSESKEGVFIIATANNVAELPSEFKRKGRFDEIFYVALPTEQERVEILTKHLVRFGCSDVEQEYIEAVAADADKFSGAELENLASEASLIAFDEGRPQKVTLADLQKARKSIVPLAIQDSTKIEHMEKWAATARPASTIKHVQPEKTSYKVNMDFN